MSKNLFELLLCVILSVAIVIVITGGTIIATSMIETARNTNTNSCQSSK